MNTLIHEPAWRIALFCLFAGAVSFFALVSQIRQISAERQHRIKEQLALLRRADQAASEEDDASTETLSVPTPPTPRMLPRMALIGFHLLVCFGSLAFGLPALTFARYIHLGNAAYAAHDYEGAVAKYNIALETNSAVGALNAQVQYAVAQRDAGGEVGDMRRLVNLHPGNGGNHNDLGNALLNRGDIPGAIQEFQKALELVPQDAAILNNLGNAYAAAHRYPEAIVQFQKALQIAPNQEQSLFNLGNAMVATKQLDQAVRYYRLALEHDARLAPAYFNMADALAMQGKRADAVVALDNFIQVAANQPAYAVSISNARQQLAKWRSAPH